MSAAVEPLACAEFGDAGRPALLLLHPGGMLGRAWAPFIRRWSADFHILVPGLAPQRQPSVRRYADAVRALMEAPAGFPAAGPAHVVGASLGANVALGLAVAAPGLVASLILDSAQAGGPPSRLVAALAGALRLLGALAPGALAARLLARQFAAWAPADRAAVAADLRAVGLAGLGAHIAAHADHDLRGGLGRIAAPTLVLAGADDLLTRRGEPQRLAAAIPGAELRIIAGAGHVTFLRQPARFAELADAFLYAQRGA